MVSRGGYDEEDARVQGTLVEPRATNPDGRRVYVTPEVLRGHMIYLFDRQIQYQQELDVNRVNFLPDRVDYELGSGIPPRWWRVDARRLWYCYQTVLMATRIYLVSYFRQKIDEEGTDDDLLTVDLSTVDERIEVKCGKNPRWNTVDEVHESINTIGVAPLKEQCDLELPNLILERLGSAYRRGGLW